MLFVDSFEGGMEFFLEEICGLVLDLEGVIVWGHQVLGGLKGVLDVSCGLVV